tara:strand:- start:33 stop:470 length:438 start_codon:yes stop_codon:yes gene_type:complete
MNEALRLAGKAYREGEIPVGAVIVQKNKIIGRGYNQRERLKDPTAHAEILAITAAAGTLEDWRLTDCTLYVTKEPCPMCAGAIINSRMRLLVFGAYDEEKGCCGSLYQLCGDRRLDSKTAVKGGVEEEKCTAILQEFFQTKRNPK